MKKGELTAAGRLWLLRKGSRPRIPTFAHRSFLATMSYARGEADVIAGVNLSPQSQILPHTDPCDLLPVRGRPFVL